MKLDDVFGTAGDHQLSDFDWGAAAVMLYNSLVAKDLNIDVSHTGRQAFDKLRRLPSSTLMVVLSREVKLEGSTVEFIGTVREQAAGVPPTVPQGSRKMSPIAIVLMIVLSVIGVGLTFSVRNGAQVDTAVFNTVITSMIEIMKEENKKDQAAQQQQQPAPADPTQ